MFLEKIKGKELFIIFPLILDNYTENGLVFSLFVNFYMKKPRTN